MTKKEELLNEIENLIIEGYILQTVEDIGAEELNRNKWMIEKEDLINRIELDFDDNLYSENRNMRILRWEFILPDES